MFKRITSALFLMSIIVLVPGCLQQPTRVSHQMLANRDKIPSGFPKNKSFAIVGGEYKINGTKQKDELQNQELEKKLTLSLSNEGYTLVSQEAIDSSTDYAIVYQYGISSYKKTVYEPQYATGSVWTSRSNALINTTTYVPVERTYFTKTLTLLVAELPEYLRTRKVSAPIWQSQAWIVDESDDIRKNLDFLIVQSISKFGRDSAGTVATDMYDDNKLVVKLRSNYFDNNKTK